MQEHLLDKNNSHTDFHYEYFLSKARSHFTDWLNTYTLITTAPVEYIRKETKLLSHTEQKYTLMAQVRALILMHTLIQHLKGLVKKMRQCLTEQGNQKMEMLQGELGVCVEAFKVCVETGYQKKMHKEVKSLLDEVFLYTHDIELMTKIVFCIRMGHLNFSPADRTLNVCRFDTTTIDYYQQQTRKYCQKCPGLTPEDFEVQNHGAALYNKVINSRRSIEDERLGLMLIKAKRVEKDQRDSPISRLYALNYKFMKLNILSDKVSLLNESEEYEELLGQMIQKSEVSHEALMAVLWSEPGLFLEMERGKKKRSGEVEKWIVKQIEGIEVFTSTRQVSGVIPYILTSQGMSEFLDFINEVVLYVQFIFESSPELQTYAYYTRILQFLKKCYLSFKSREWFFPLKFMTTMENNILSDMHINIDKDIIQAVTEMITQLSKEELPVWVEYSEGQVKTVPVNRLEFVSAILQYLEECDHQDNNFFEFSEPIPSDLPSSILMVELVNIRFHELEPNQQQIKYYTTLLEECLKHNVNPSFSWFKGLDSVINEYDREVEYDMVKEIQSPKIRDIFQNIINDRDLEHIGKVITNVASPVEIINELKYAIGIDLESSLITISQGEDHIAFELLTIMSSLLEQGVFDFVSQGDEVRMNHLHLCLVVYNKRVKYSRESEQYYSILTNIILPWMGLGFEEAKRIMNKFPQFFNPFICSPYIVEIINSFVDFVTRCPFEQVQAQLKEQTVRIIDMVLCPLHTPTEIDSEQAEELASLLMSRLDPSLPKELYCCLGLLILALMTQPNSLEVVLTPQILQYWMGFVSSLQVFEDEEDVSNKAQLATITHLSTRDDLLAQITLVSVQEIFKMARFKEFAASPTLWEDKSCFKGISKAGLLLMLVRYAILGKHNKIVQIVKALPNVGKGSGDAKAMSILDLKSSYPQGVQEPKESIHITIIKAIRESSPDSEQSKPLFDSLMKFLDVVLIPKEYLMFAVELSRQQYVQHVPMQTILSLGSDNKLTFSNFVATLHQRATVPGIHQECLDALSALEARGEKLNVGALFFLIMVITMHRNKEIEEVVFRNLQRCHVFKVKPLSIRSQSIAIQTLKAFTSILIEEAKRLIKLCPENVFRLSNKQLYENSETINRLFGIIYCLPNESLNQIKLSKPIHVEEKEEEEWESQKESIGEEEEAKESDEEEELENEEVGVDEDNDGDASDQYSDYDEEVEIEQEEISDILLNKKAGYTIYNDYIKIREQLDILIRGNYKWLEEEVKSKNKLSPEIEKEVSGIIATLNLLESAQNRVITKMNPHLYNALMERGLSMPRTSDEDESKEEKEFKLNYKMFSDSEFDPDSDDDEGDQEDSDYEQSDGWVEEEEAPSNEPSTGVQIFDTNVDTSTFNSLGLEALQRIRQDFEDESQMGIQNLVIIDPNNPPSEWMMKKQSSLEACEVGSVAEHFTSSEIDKMIEILLFKMFDLPIEQFSRYISFYRHFGVSSAGSSSFLNSMLLLMRLNEDNADLSELEKFPMVHKCCREPGQIYTSYEIFIRNAICILTNLDITGKNCKYSQGEPGIETVELLADSIKLPKQPHLVSMILLAFRNMGDDQFLTKIEEAIVSLCSVSKEKGRPHVKTKHIVDVVKSSFHHHCTLMYIDGSSQMVSRKAPEFLNAYLQHATPLLLQDMEYMDKRLSVLEQTVLSSPETKEFNMVMMLEITKIYESCWETVYHSIKELLQLVIKTYPKKYEDVKEQLLESLFTNQSLISALTISLHHLNFAARHLKKSGESPPQNFLYLVKNQFRAPCLIALIYSAAGKFIEFQNSKLVEEYLNNFKPGEIKFSRLSKVANLLLPLLDLEIFCCTKFQKVILPPIFDNPESGYRLPLAFRITYIEDKKVGSQKLNITRECSFDIAYHQLKTSRFQIQYDQQEGNDQGGLRRQFMRGWRGVGIGEEFFFVGKILGIAFRDANLYGGTLDLTMTTALTNYKPDLKLMEDIDPVIHKSLVWLSQNEVEDMGLNFTRTRSYYGLQLNEELKPGGIKIPVTDKNKLQYIDLYIQHFLFAGRKREIEELKRGFFSIIPSKCVSILTPQELLIHLSGVDTIDIAQLKKSVRYEGYSSFSEVIKWFWELVESFSEKDKQTLLYFLTGTHKVPLGLKNYDLTIERVHDTSRLPVAHTCFNTLDLPEYTTRTVFLEKLKTAIFEGHDTYSIM